MLDVETSYPLPYSCSDGIDKMESIKKKKKKVDKSVDKSGTMIYNIIIKSREGD
jgi:hypothetical protein